MFSLFQLRRTWIVLVAISYYIHGVYAFTYLGGRGKAGFWVGWYVDEEHVAL
jgi:hypothetical protein